MKYKSDTGARWSTIRRKMIEEGAPGLQQYFVLSTTINNQERTEASLVYYDDVKILSINKIWLTKDLNAVVVVNAVCKLKQVRP